MVLGAEREEHSGQQTRHARAQRGREEAQQFASPHHGHHLDDRDDERDRKENRAAEESGDAVRRDEGSSPLTLFSARPEASGRSIPPCRP